MNHPFPYVRRDESPIAGLPAGTYVVHFTAPFPRLWWLISLPRYIACRAMQARGYIVRVLEPEPVAMARGQDLKDFNDSLWF